MSIWNTPGLIDRMSELWDEGHSASNMGRMLSAQFRLNNITKGQVLGKAHRLGFEPRTMGTQIKPNGRTATRRKKAAGRKLLGGKMEYDRRPRPIRRFGDTHLPPAKTCQYIQSKRGPYTDKDKCGGATLEGSSYCGPHHARCYLPPKVRNEA